MPQPLNRTTCPAPYLPERFVQFGEGNFLRAFADWVIQQMNRRLDFHAGVVIVQPREKNRIKALNAQDGLYTVRLTGIQDGALQVSHEIITCINRGVHPYLHFKAYLEIARNPELQFVISNTTEAGIAFVESDQFDDTPPSSFPGKLTRLLYERFRHFAGAPDKGLMHLPCELLERNGDALKAIVLQYVDHWKLPDVFNRWIITTCSFCNSLVDRIVPGYPEDIAEDVFETTGFIDPLLVEAEQFHLWVIEADARVRAAFPAPDAGVDVRFTDDLDSYRQRKVRVLNGAHTAMVPLGILSGLATVREAVEHPALGTFLEQLIFKEILPTLQGDREELIAYAQAIVRRFQNPAIRHQLSSIALNSVPKFNTRLLHTMLDAHASTGTWPPGITLAFAALLRFYRGDYAGGRVPINDDPDIVSRLGTAWEKQQTGTISMDQFLLLILSDKRLWDRDLSVYVDLRNRLADTLELISANDPGPSLENLMYNFAAHNSDQHA